MCTNLEERIRLELPDHSARVIQELASVVDTLVRTFNPRFIYLFGSQARGDATTESDFDLLIVVEPTDQPRVRLAQRAYHAVGDHEVPLEFVFMPSDEFERRSRTAASLAATARREGRLLYAA